MRAWSGLTSLTWSADRLGPLRSGEPPRRRPADPAHRSGAEAARQVVNPSTFPRLGSFLPERTQRSGTMEDVYHYTRSPAWEELVSKIQHWRLFFSFFSAHFAQQKEQNESCCCNALSCRGLIRSLFCFGGVSSSLTRFACFPLCCCDLFSGLTL